MEYSKDGDGNYGGGGGGDPSSSYEEYHTICNFFNFNTIKDWSINNSEPYNRVSPPDAEYILFLNLEVQERKEGDLLIAEMGDVNDGVEAEDGKDGDGDEGGLWNQPPKTE